jgi:hypothetical protein
MYRLDLIIAALVAVSASLAGAVSYREFIGSERPTALVVSAIPKERTEFGLYLNKDQVGQVQSWFESYDSGTKRHYLVVNFWGGESGRELIAQFTTRAEFNALGQLILGDATFHNRRTSIFAGFFQANPIVLQIAVKDRPTLFNWPFLIPGPLVLQENRGAGSFSLLYAPFEVNSELIAALAKLPALFNLVGLSLKQEGQ